MVQYRLCSAGTCRWYSTIAVGGKIQVVEFSTDKHPGNPGAVQVQAVHERQYRRLQTLEGGRGGRSAARGGRALKLSTFFD